MNWGRLKCRLGRHDWTFLYYGDRLGRKWGWGVHECTRCGTHDIRFCGCPWLA